jgi:hypothetical protein
MRIEGMRRKKATAEENETKRILKRRRNKQWKMKPRPYEKYKEYNRRGKEKHCVDCGSMGGGYFCGLFRPTVLLNPPLPPPF